MSGAPGSVSHRPSFSHLKIVPRIPNDVGLPNAQENHKAILVRTLSPPRPPMLKAGLPQSPFPSPMKTRTWRRARATPFVSVLAILSLFLLSVRAQSVPPPVNPVAKDEPSTSARKKAQSATPASIPPGG